LRRRDRYRIAAGERGEGFVLRIRGAGWFLFFSLAATSGAFAAEATDKPSESIFLLEIVLLVVLGRLFGEWLLRIGQPAVMGQIAAGIVLGPSILGAFFPSAEAFIFPSSPAQSAMIGGLATFGVLMLLLLSGMETDLRLVRRIGRPAVIISLAGIAFPFILGVAVAEAMPAGFFPDAAERLITALFLGTALSISSVKIVAMVVRELDFQRRNIGQILLATAILDDTLAWIILGIISSLGATGIIDFGSALRSIAGTAIFLLLSFTIGRRIVFLLIRFSNDTFVGDAAVISTILALVGMMALATDAIGVHTVLGAFVAGILVGNSPILTRQIDEQLRGLTTALFMPVFFGLSGLHADLRVLADPATLALTIGFTAVASVGKFTGAFVGGRLAGLSARESVALGCGTNARGSTEIIVATIGLSLGVLDQRLYTIIVTMALVTTLAMPSMLRWALGRLPFTEEEKERLRRESFAERSFIAGLERLLIAVDESASGVLASRLAGLVAGSRGFPTTVLHIDAQRNPERVAAAPDDAVRSAAEAGKEKSGEAEPPAAVPITLKVHDAPLAEAVAKEAENGYGLLAIGVAGATSKGRFTPRISAAAAAFRGALAVVVARGTNSDGPTERRLRILVPVSGNEASRRALEFALSVARSTGGRVMALYVANERRRDSQRIFRFARLGVTENEQMVLRDAAELADEYDAQLRTAISTGATPEERILRYAARGRYDLIVLGVTRRAGEELYFGEVAEAVLAGADRSIVLLARPAAG
jgi:Kef-type K+ transport system membrane component KefB/nucleotide-binding universal stress UspA family protein